MEQTPLYEGFSEYIRVFAPCNKKCGKVIQRMKLLAPMVIGGPIVGLAYLFRSFRGRMNLLCADSCRQKALLVQIKSEKDPLKKRKYMKKLVRTKKDIATHEAYIKRRLEQVRKISPDKYNKFLQLYKAVKRVS